MQKIFKPQNFFLILALFFGLLIVFVSPPFQSPDEPCHLYRMYELSQGRLLPCKQDKELGGKLPVGLYDYISSYAYMQENYTKVYKRTSFSEIKTSMKHKINKDKTFFAQYPNTARYSPIAYLPQSLGCAISSMFTDCVYWILIWSKIFLLLFYVVAGYYSIKSIPFLKWASVLILLSPMSLTLGASISADGVLIPLCILYFSKILQYSFGPNKIIDKKQLALLTILALMISLTKQSFLLTLFVLFIPKEKFNGSYLKSITIVLLPSFIASILWSKAIYSFFIPLNGSDIKSHADFILNNPVKFWLLSSKYIPTADTGYLFQVIGVLGWLIIYLDLYYYRIFTAFIALNTFFSGENDSVLNKYKIAPQKKLILCLLILINFLLICAMMFLTWTPADKFNEIEGIQGRYFLPLILPFLTMCTLLLRPFKSNKYLKTANILFLIYSCIYLIIKIHEAFYAPPLMLDGLTLFK